MNYIPMEELLKLIPKNDYNAGACDMLYLISNKMGWEETETEYFIEFFDISKGEIKESYKNKDKIYHLNKRLGINKQ